MIVIFELVIFAIFVSIQFSVVVLPEDDDNKSFEQQIRYNSKMCCSHVGRYITKVYFIYILLNIQYKKPTSYVYVYNNGLLHTYFIAVVLNKKNNNCCCLKFFLKWSISAVCIM